MPELVPHLPLAEEPLLLEELNHRISSEFASLIALCRSISRSNLDPMKIELVLAAPPLLLESGRCRRLGMIVSELITNAARHAFAGRPGRIRVELLRAGGLLKCIASNNRSAAARIQPGHGPRIVEEPTKAPDGGFERWFGGAGGTSIWSSHPMSRRS